MPNNNLIYKNQKNNQEKLSWKQRKENTLTSLSEVEHFLSNYKRLKKSMHLYKFFK
jgi:hypothetical protein